MPTLPEQNGHYHQPSLDGLAVMTEPETILDHAMVESLPAYRKQGKGAEWGCAVSCPPDIFHQDRNDSYQVHARTYAPEAKKKRLRPGDIVTLRGSVHTQEIQLSGGETQVIYHLTVTDIIVMKRARRESISVYERKRGK